MKKFFDPKTVPSPQLRPVPIDYFEKVRMKLRLPFAFPDNPQRMFDWNDPHVPRFLFEFQAHGGKEVLVDADLYQEKIKELALL